MRPKHPRAVRFACRWLAVALLGGTGWVCRAPAQDAASNRGRLIAQAIELEAPEEACIAYDQQHATRQWIIPTAAPAEFIDGLRQLGLLTPPVRELVAPANWTTAPGGGAVLHPPATVLQSLTPAERSALYAVLARWPENSAERWPLVFRDEAALRDLAALEQVPTALVERVGQLSYPFPGGLAFSDYSLLVAEFPDQAQRLAFLRAASRVAGTLPRLQVSTALKLSDVLDYWTVQQSNPYVRPLLDALLEADIAEGVDLLSLLPGPPRVVAHEIDPDEVPATISINTYLIAASVALPPHPVGDLESIFEWLNASFTPAAGPLRFGDLLLLQYPAEPVVAYACAYVADDLVFARDPVGLGLWRFMTVAEILRRNPHFRDARFIAYRSRHAH